MNWNAPGLNIFLSIKVCDLPEDLYPFTPEQKNKTLCLVAHGGNSLWELLPQPKDIDKHPFDHYTINQINRFSKDFLKDECEILFPNDSYNLPLQKIGRFLNLSSQSPIGLDICDEFGLWFAFRGVFLISEEIMTKTFPTPPSLCVSCSDRPCLLETDLGLARLRCPEKKEHRYNKEQIAFHENALNLIKANGATSYFDKE